ncbi:CapA family protein [Lutispora sp.]|uniref:CapA family protein n=1 Tax=Lutispora sp. TaxID=2828727 RepID=UPI0035622BD4
MKLRYTMLRGLLNIIGFIKGDKYIYSQEYEDNFKYMDLGEKLWWGYKSVVKQIERAEKGKGIEEYFANQNLNFKEGNEFENESRIIISAGGDLSASEMIFPENTLHLWHDVQDFYFNADIVCANLEAPIVPEKPPVGVPGMCLTAPKLNISPQMFERFIDEGKGVNFFSTANNHSLDQGEHGIISTLDFLDSKGYLHVGTARTQEEQNDIPIIEKKGIKTAFISYTYCLNGEDSIPGKEFMVNHLRLNKPETDISLIENHVKLAKEKGADIVVAMLHWSIEFETYPIQNIIDMGHRIMECGVDVILGGHPHVAQPMERYRFYDPYDKREKEGFIIYSLGELVSLNLFSKNSRLALLLKLEISKGMERGLEITKLTGLKVLPIYILYRSLEDGKGDYRVLDFRKTLNTLELGENPHGFSKKDIKELKRLEKLLYERVLPKDSLEILG